MGSSDRSKASEAQRSNAVTEDDLLLPFEKQNVREPYRDYFVKKRNNFFATIQAFPHLWECFLRLDEVWLRGFNNLERPRTPDHLLPILLFSNGHAQFRVAFEPGFSSCVNEAWNVLRSSIESVAYACKILRRPELAEVWLIKHDGRTEMEAFKNAFERNKKESLFPREYGLDRLHTFWSRLSEWGTHTTVASMSARFAAMEADTDTHFRSNYFVTEPSKLAGSLYYLLDASAAIENVFFNAFEKRLNLDPELVRQRSQFGRQRQAVAQELIRRFNIQAPTVWKDQE